MAVIQNVTLGFKVSKGMRTHLLQIHLVVEEFVISAFILVEVLHPFVK